MNTKALLAVFTLTIFASASLLFAVQPMVARLLLPKLGGSPLVWNTAQVFFQSMLLFGYLYAHMLQKHVRLKHQVVAHVSIMLYAVIFLPITFTGTPPTQGAPVLWMLGALFMTAGLPFFVLSASSPLFQAWFAHTDHEQAKDPYHLYAASNAGSMFTLLSYPFVFEPTMKLATQGWLWATGFGMLIVLTTTAGVLAIKSTHPSKSNIMGEKKDATPPNDAPNDAPTAIQIVWWLVCSFIPSSLILSVTTYLTTDISSFPLIWILPLTLYLLSFIFVFAKRQIIPRWLTLSLLPAMVLPTLVTIIYDIRQDIWIAIPVHLSVFFVLCMVFHGELVRTRPNTKNLTQFYLWMSFGGVLGGAFTALLAPLIFVHHWEYPVLLLLGLVCLPITDDIRNKDVWFKRALILITLFLMGTGMYIAHSTHQRDLSDYTIPLIVTAITMWRIDSHTRQFGVLISCVVIAALMYEMQLYNTLHSARSYFGIHYVRKHSKENRHQLTHGRILHGSQWRDERSNIPVSYFHTKGPLGRTINMLQKRPQGLSKVAVVGLGTGTIATYAKKGQQYDFYEIDPVVVDIAKNPKYFSYLSDHCKGTCKTIIGDGRLKLGEAKKRSYDLIVLDAYTSDAIPVHLITREALALYRSKLALHGIIAFHVSNNHLDLFKVAAALAKDANMVSYNALHEPSKELKKLTVQKSHWVMLARKDEDMTSLLQDPLFVKNQKHDSSHVWTDDFTNIISIYKWR